MLSDVDRIKEKVSIVDVVSEYVDLKPAGTRLRGLSPFTSEKTPSFYVSPEQGLYHCFSTNQGGDIFTFVQVMEGVDFAGALKLLAERAGIELTSQVKRREPTDELFAVMHEAVDFYQRKLREGSTARALAKRRGISEESIKKWSLGYAPDDWRALTDHLGKLFPTEVILKAGLAKIGKGNQYDTFRDRLMFPIRDSAGRFIAFSGRRLDAEKEAKYINSPETPIFNKSKALYGFYEAKQSLRQYNFAVLVEGQIDLVLAHQVGSTNTVASSGTAFTIDHLALLKRYTQNLLLAFDSDRAGLAAAIKVAGLAYRDELAVKMMLLPNGQDPADVIKNGPADWKRLIKEAVHVPVAAALQIKSEAHNETNFRSRLRSEVLPLIKLVKSPLVADEILEELATVSELEKDLLEAELNSIGSGSETTKYGSASIARDSLVPQVKPIKPGSHGSDREALLKHIALVRRWLEKHSDKPLLPLPLNLKTTDLPELKSAEVVAADYRDVSRATQVYEILVADWQRLERRTKLLERKTSLQAKANKSEADFVALLEIDGELDKLTLE